MSASPAQIVFPARASERAIRPALWQLGLAAIIAFVVVAQGISAPFQKDAEPQSAEWIQSVARGRLLAPRDYYGYLIEKPPLYYWLSAAATRLDGGKTGEVSARIVPVLAATALAVEILIWTVENVGAVEGWLAFLFLIGTYGFSSRATLALTDMLMTFLIVSALIILYPQIDGRATRGRTAAAIVVLELGILTKGPIAAVLAGFAIFIYLLIDGRNPLTLLRERWTWVFVGVIVGLTFFWYWFWFSFGTWKIFSIFMTENFGHFLPARLGGTGEAARPAWYIVARLIGGSMPIVFLIPAAIAGFLTGEIDRFRRKSIAFQASLAIAVIVFFSVASAKRDDYILPALPGVAILCASVFALGAPRGGRWPCARALRAVAVAAIAITMLFAVGAGGVMAGMHARLGFPLESSDADLIALYIKGFATLQFGFLLFALAVIAGAAAAGYGLVRRNAVVAGAAVGFLTLAGSMLANAVLRPELAWERSAKTFEFVVHEDIGSAPLYVVLEPIYDFTFYYGHAAPPLMGHHREVPARGTKFYLIANRVQLRALAPDYRERLTLVVQSHQLSSDGGLALYVYAPTRAR